VRVLNIEKIDRTKSRDGSARLNSNDDASCGRALTAITERHERFVIPPQRLLRARRERAAEDGLSSTTASPTAEKFLTHLDYRPDIDGLRAVAVLFVLGFHAFPNWFRGGFVGVDIFFVISGFLISAIIFKNLKSGSFNYREFQRRRIKRIFPALIVVLSATLLAGWFTLLGPEYRNLGKYVAASAVFLPNFALWNEAGYFESAAELKPLLHLWSLGIEEQFYLFWPLLVAVVWRRKVNLFKLLALICIVSFAINIIATYTAPVAAFYSPLSRFWELMIGAGLAWLSLRQPAHAADYANIKSVVGMILLLQCALLLNDQKAFPGWWALLPTIGSSLLISAGPESWLNRHVLNSSALVFIGKISYPLYLWHWPLLSFAWIVGDGAPSTSVRVGLLSLAFVLALITYLFAEKPIHSDVERAIGARQLIMVMVAAGLCGALLYVTDGMKFRSVNGNPAGFDLDFESDPKFNSCFLKENEGLPFNSLCDGANAEAIRPLVLVWGDSHAQSLALGLDEQSKLRNFDFAVFTASACPPVIDFDVAARPQCQSINRFVLEKVRSLKPHTVILSAFWYLYNGYQGFSELDYNKLARTIDLLKREQVANIVLVGQLPTFLIDQPKVGNRVFVSGKVDRTFYKFNFESAAVNEKIRDLAAEQKVNFVSPLDLLCNDSGCLISALPTKLVPLSWDYAHPTRAGANYILERAIGENRLSLP